MVEDADDNNNENLWFYKNAQTITYFHNNVQYYSLLYFYLIYITLSILYLSRFLV